MGIAQWFHEQLQTSAAGFIWAVEQVPAERHHTVPPNPSWLGTWSAARHAFHMLYYEKKNVLKILQEYAGMPITVEMKDRESVAWEQSSQDVTQLLEQFQRTRSEVLALLASFDETAWNTTREQEAWGEITVRWHITKAYQHTCEHTHDVLSLALFWDFAIYDENRQP